MIHRAKATDQVRFLLDVLNPWNVTSGALPRWTASFADKHTVSHTAAQHEADVPDWSSFW